MKNKSFTMAIVALGFYGIGFQSPTLCFWAGGLLFGNAIANFIWVMRKND